MGTKKKVERQMTKLMGKEEGQMKEGGTDWGREQQTVLDGGSDGERCHE